MESTPHHLSILSMLHATALARLANLPTEDGNKAVLTIFLDRENRDDLECLNDNPFASVNHVNEDMCSVSIMLVDVTLSIGDITKRIFLKFTNGATVSFFPSSLVQITCGKATFPTNTWQWFLDVGMDTYRATTETFYADLQLMGKTKH